MMGRLADFSTWGSRCPGSFLRSAKDKIAPWDGKAGLRARLFIFREDVGRLGVVEMAAVSEPLVSLMYSLG